MTVEQALAIIGALFMLLFGLVGYVWKRMEKRVDELAEKLETGKSAEFRASMIERSRAWDAWRSGVDRLLERVSDLLSRFPHAEKSIEELREWKHVRGDPYVNAMDAMNKRVDRIERVLNGRLT